MLVSGEGRECGAVLAFVILILLALSLLVHGALVESLTELSASNAAVRELRATAAARSSVQRALVAGGGAWMDSAARWEDRSGDTLRTGALSTVATLRRLGAEAWLVEGVARLGSVEVAHAARLAWSFDPLVRVSALQGVVSVGEGAPVVVEGTIDASTPTALTPPSELGGCDPWLDSLDARYAVAPLSPVAFLPSGSGAPGLGLLDFASILARVQVSVADVGTPRPLEAGGSCVTADPWNWGDPDRPWGACGTLLVLRGSDGDLRVQGGSGQGVLAIDGTLTLSAGARFKGLVIASGSVRLEDGAVLEGLAIASGGIYVASDAQVLASGCWSVRALAAQRSTLGRLVPLPGTGWIGPL